MNTGLEEIRLEDPSSSDHSFNRTRDDVLMGGPQPATMEAFQSVVLQLRILAEATIRKEPVQEAEFTIDQALNGGPSTALRRLIAVSDLRATGTFFTGRSLADRLVSKLGGVLPRAASVVDPACGAGDLLLACVRQLPVERTLSATLENWGQRIYGFDISPEFIEAARIRLVLQAVARGVEIDRLIDFESVLPGVQVKDGLASWELPDGPACIVLNPPYTAAIAPEGCSWGSGKVSLAAVFIEHCLRSVPHGSTIAAILPDVLRSGSRYDRWRKVIAGISEQVSLDLDDQFDSSTDVHVYTVVMTSRAIVAHIPASPNSPLEARTVGDDFDVNVGAVVPHRDEEIGPVYPYLHARSVPRWATCIEIMETKAFQGRAFTPPFVVVRRTSRPEDAHRAVASVVVGDSPIAIENHLIVLTPKSRDVTDCYRLLNNLYLGHTSEWLNQQIRCRHLTVRALRNLPWWGEE